MENNKKKLQIPSTCALLFMLMIVCAILTWIVPAGEFDTEKVGNLNKVIAGTYHTVEASPVGPWATIMSRTGILQSRKVNGHDHVCRRCR